MIIEKRKDGYDNGKTRDLKEILKDPLFNFPSYELHESMISLRYEYAQNFIVLLKKWHIKDSIINQVNNVFTHFCRCISEYSVGRIDCAINEFRLAISDLNVELYVKDIGETTFYRARYAAAGYLQPDELFHIPYNMRYIVKTERYSYPGLPCLYMASSMNLCKVELGARDFSELCIAKFKATNKQLKVFDLTCFLDIPYTSIQNEDVERLIVSWPLIAFCSISHSDNRECINYRAEYIIPQMLLIYVLGLHDDVVESYQHVRGIKYFSVRNSIVNLWINGNPVNMYKNYVFPAIGSNENGYCRELKQLFIFDSFQTG